MDKVLITKKVFTAFIASLLLTTVGVGVGVKFVPIEYGVGFSLIAFILLVVGLITAGINRARREKNDGEDNPSHYSINLPMWFVYVFAVIQGFGISPVILLKVEESGLLIVLLAFLITVALFIIMAIIGFHTKSFNYKLGMGLFLALLVLLVLYLINFFIGGSVLIMFISWISIVVFSIYIVHDMSRMNDKNFCEEDIPMLVLDLYLDFINLLLNIIRRT